MGTLPQALFFSRKMTPDLGKPLTCGYVAAGAFFVQENGPPIFLEAPNLWVGGLIKNLVGPLEFTKLVQGPQRNLNIPWMESIRSIYLDVRLDFFLLQLFLRPLLEA